MSQTRFLPHKEQNDTNDTKRWNEVVILAAMGQDFFHFEALNFLNLFLDYNSRIFFLPYQSSETVYAKLLFSLAKTPLDADKNIVS